MASDRYDAVLTRIKNRMGMRASEVPSDIKELMADNAHYMALLHPYGWSWLRMHVELTAQTHSVTLDASFDSSDTPRTHGMWVVRGRIGTSGDWQSFDYADIGQIMEWPSGNRETITSSDALPTRVYWTVRTDDGVRTIELYPIQCAGILDLDIYYLRSLDEIPSSDEDAAFIWPQHGYDSALAWLCMSDIAFGRNDLTREAAVWSRFTQIMKALLQGEGVPASRIHFPPRRIIQEVGMM